MSELLILTYLLLIPVAVFIGGFLGMMMAFYIEGKLV